MNAIVSILLIVYYAYKSRIPNLIMRRIIILYSRKTWKEKPMYYVIIKVYRLFAVCVFYFFFYQHQFTVLSYSPDRDNVFLSRGSKPLLCVRARGRCIQIRSTDYDNTIRENRPCVHHIQRIWKYGYDAL